LQNPTIALKNIKVTLNKKLTDANVDVNATATIEAGGKSAQVNIIFEKGLTKSIEFVIKEGVKLGLFGVDLTITNVLFLPDRNPNDTNFWDPQLELQGTLTLPEKFGKLIGAGQITASVTGKSKFVINSDGASLEGGGVITIGNIKFSLFNVVNV